MKTSMKPEKAIKLYRHETLNEFYDMTEVLKYLNELI